MQLTENVFLVGSGEMGLNLTNAYDCNIYLLDTGKGFVLIDSGAGMEPEAVIREIEKSAVSPGDITDLVITHGHADHSGGASRLKELTGAKVVCSVSTAQILESCNEEAISLPECRRNGTYPADYEFRKCTVDVQIRKDETRRMGDVHIQFLNTPGHSFDSVSCFVPEWGALFCADVVFEGGKIAALKTWDFSYSQLRESIRKLERLPVNQLFPGHLQPVIQDGHLPLRKALQTFDAHHYPVSIV